MSHDCRPYAVSAHARNRWAKRFPGRDLDAAFARAVFVWTDRSGRRHLIEAEGGAEFVVGRSARAPAWTVVTVLVYVPRSLPCRP